MPCLAHISASFYQVKKMNYNPNIQLTANAKFHAIALGSKYRLLLPLINSCPFAHTVLNVQSLAQLHYVFFALP